MRPLPFFDVSSFTFGLSGKSALKAVSAASSLLRSVSTKVCASMVGGALGLGLLRPMSALAAPGIGNVLPIPTTIEVFPGVEIHLSDTDPSTVWNFQGASGIAFISTTVTRTNRKTGAQQVLPSSNHMQCHQGIYVGRDGHVREITFAFV